jgi:hypothetical protein
MAAGMTELDTAIDAALVHLDRAATEAALHDDPLQAPFTALASFLRAQRQLYVDGAVSLAAHLEQARQPVRDEELQRAVVRGIAQHAWDVVKAINLRTGSWLAAGAMGVMLLGFSAGAWWQHAQSAAEIASATDTVIAAHDGFGTGLKALDAAVWLEIIRMNPRITDAIHTCRPLPQSDGGSACALPVWTMLPPPKTETPATH